jgi:hypothetical protein
MYTNAVAGSVMLCLQHDFYNIIFNIKHKLYIASGSAPPSPKEKSWVRAWWGTSRHAIFQDVGVHISKAVKF